MTVFVNYAGPKLAAEQKQIVRSQVMVVVRGQQRKQARIKTANTTASTANPRLLAPAQDKNKRNGSSNRTEPLDDQDQDQDDMPTNKPNAPTAATITRRRNNNPYPVTSTSTALTRRRHPNYHPQPYDMRVPPRESTHPTGVDARTFADYLSRCSSYASYLDSAFSLVNGFRQPSYFRPDLSKPACIYIGWLLTAGVLDAVRGGNEERGLVYPWYEYLAVRELQLFIDAVGERVGVHEVVYPVVILGCFEMVRFSPRAVTHIAAVERFVKSRGGLVRMPDVMQHLVIMTDTLASVCLHTPLAFSTLGPVPTFTLQTAPDFPAGNQLRSCPLLLCDDEGFALAAQYVDSSIRGRLVAVLRAAGDSFEEFFFPFSSSSSSTSSLGVGLHTVGTLSEDGSGVDEDLELDLLLDDILDNTSAAAANTTTTNIPALLLETCALAARITRRTIFAGLDGFDDAENGLDVLKLYLNARFIGLRAWTGLPYVYVWMNLIGFAASTDTRMQSYFVAEVVRCAFSYGCYQMEVFQAVLKNFLHLRNAVEGRKRALTAYAAE